MKMWILLTAVLLSVSASLLWVYFATMMGNMIEMIQHTTMHALFQYIALMLFVLVLCRVLSYFAHIINVHISTNRIQTLKQNYLTSLLTQDNIDKAMVSTQFTYDLEKIRTDYYENIPVLLADVCAFITSSYVLMRMSWKITIVFYVLAFLILVLPHAFRDKIISLQKKVSHANEGLVDVTNDIVDGIEEVKDYHLQEIVSSSFLTRNKFVSKAIRHFEYTSSGISEVSHLCITVLGIVGFIMGAIGIMQGAFSYGTMVSIVQLSNTLVTPLFEVVQVYPKYTAAKGLLETIQNKIQKKTQLMQQIPVCRNIRLENISYEVNGKTILHDFDVTFEIGKKYLIVGENGSGKSTLLKLLSGSIVPTKGNVYIDNQKVEKYRLCDIDYMRQTSHIFHVSIYENISMNRNFDKVIVKDILQKVGLWKRIETLDKGVDTILDDKIVLSGGEIERLLLARTFVGKKHIGLFDEPNAAIDTHSASQILQMILDANFDMTIVVAHRIDETIKNQFDEIIYMKSEIDA